MGIEIERRFLVSDSSIVQGASRELIVQGYFFAKNGYAARIRRLHHVAGDGSTRESRATLTVKGPRRGAARAEFEMEIDQKFAENMLKEIDHKISKSRYQVIADGETWDVDVFHGDNDGLIVAECEMERSHSIRTPTWCSQEITDRREFDNENLAMRPYGTWKEAINQ
ncbi:MAG: CYTH domain-containing protein [Pseudonocardiaceae bacterium]